MEGSLYSCDEKVVKNSWINSHRLELKSTVEIDQASKKQIFCYVGHEMESHWELSLSILVH